MSNNLVFKNLKLILNGTNQKILENNTDNDYVIVGGFISNISNLDKPFSGETDTIEYFKIFNKNTLEESDLYRDLRIDSGSSFPIKKIFLKPNQEIYIKSAKNNLLNIILNYIEITDLESGFVKVVFNPKEILDYDPTWNIVGETDYYKNNEYVNLKNGSYEIEFKEISGWQKPSSTNIRVLKFKTTECIVSYDLIKASLNFKTEQVDIMDNFKWRIVGTETWIDNNIPILLDPGTYEIEFSNISNYEKPENLSIDLAPGKIYNFNIRYNYIKANLTVNLNPPSKLIDNKTTLIKNRWRIIFTDNSKSPWYYSNQTVPFYMHQNYTLEIEENDYFAPQQNLINFDFTDQNKVFNLNMIPKN